jgi:tRNA modification GTPase
MKGPKAKRSREQDTIAAIITPPGEGGIAAVRIAGPQCLTILADHFSPRHAARTSPPPFTLRLGNFTSSRGEIIDEVMAVYMPSGQSYTGLDQVEVFCHGGRMVVRRILEEILDSGARAAEPGEFTRLAFECGRIDLSRAEAVAEMIAAQTESSLRASREHLLGNYSEHVDMLRNGVVDILSEVEAGIDFTEDAPEVAVDSTKLVAMIDKLIDRLGQLALTYRGGRIINEGFTVVIGGRPNAGKSSLFNLLLKHERALVTPTPGTTRDYLLERIDLDGYAVNLIDTAGLRQGGGKIERAGQNRARDLILKSNLLIWVVDISKRGWEKNIDSDVKSFDDIDILVFLNKTDVVKRKPPVSATMLKTPLFGSCKTGAGISKLHGEIKRRIEANMPDLTSGLVVTSARHSQKLNEGIRQLRAARVKIGKSVSGELVAYELRQAVNALGEITGKVYTEQILGRIFSRFCIGK